MNMDDASCTPLVSFLSILGWYSESSIKFAINFAIKSCI